MLPKASLLTQPQREKIAHDLVKISGALFIVGAPLFYGSSLFHHLENFSTFCLSLFLLPIPIVLLTSFYYYFYSVDELDARKTRLAQTIRIVPLASVAVLVYSTLFISTDFASELGTGVFYIYLSLVVLYLITAVVITAINMKISKKTSPA